MKYFTKEWYHLMQRLDYTLCAKRIPDKDYSDSDIEELYEKELLEYCEENEQDLDDELRKEFRELYEENLKWMKYSNLPEWVFDEVDSRLIALELYPESVFDKLHEEEVKNEERFNAIMKAAEEEDKAHPELEDVREMLANHDATIMNIVADEDRIALTITDLYGLDEDIFEDKENPDTFEDIDEDDDFDDELFVEKEEIRKKLVFSGNAKISSDDGDKLVSALMKEASSEGPVITWLYEEVSKQDGTYFVDILACDNEFELYYIKIECEHITVIRES